MVLKTQIGVKKSDLKTIQFQLKNNKSSIYFGYIKMFFIVVKQAWYILLVSTVIFQVHWSAKKKTICDAELKFWFYIKKGPSKKISYERRAYESVDENSLS